MALLVLCAFLSCGGGGENGNSPTEPFACPTSFSGDWRWIINSCAFQSTGFASGMLQNSTCTVTMDTTTTAQRERGVTTNLVVNFSTSEATFTTRGSGGCDSVDRGRVARRLGIENFVLEFRKEPITGCCAGTYFINLTPPLPL